MKYTIAFDVYGTLINTSGIYNSLATLIDEKQDSLWILGETNN